MATTTFALGTMSIMAMVMWNKMGLIVSFLSCLGTTAPHQVGSRGKRDAFMQSNDCSQLLIPVGRSNMVVYQTCRISGQAIRRLRSRLATAHAARDVVSAVNMPNYSVHDLHLDLMFR